MYHKTATDLSYKGIKQKGRARAQPGKSLSQRELEGIV